MPWTRLAEDEELEATSSPSVADAEDVLSPAVAVTVTNWIVVEVIVEVELLVQDVVLDSAVATTVFDATALATEALEMALAASLVDDSRGSGLTVTVLTPEVGDSSAEPPKSVPFALAVPLRGYVPPVGRANPPPVPVPWCQWW